MENKLLLEGAVAGHMNHLYDNGEMTFGELKQLLQAIADGKVRGTEKTDGQNIFLSFNVRDQKAKAIRNKTQIKAGGLDVEEFDNFFEDHPSQALRASFVEALQAFENAIKQIDPETQEKIFGQDNLIYYNTEVMNPGTPGLEEDDPRSKGTTNVIPYDKKTLLIHRVGHGAFDKKTAKKLEIDVSNNFDVLEQSIMGMSTEDPSLFSVETNQIKKLPPMKGKEIVPATISEIDNLVGDQGLNDSSTINDYVISQVAPIIDNFGLTEDRNKLILKRVMMTTGGPTLREITKGIPTELSDEISQFVKSFKYAEFTKTLQNILHNFSVAAIDGLESSFISDNGRQINFLQDELRASIQKIAKSSNERAKKELERQMEKLKSAEGINTPSEGFVFNWNGVTYKLTGNFAPANQILGMERFQRFGPIEPQETNKDALEGDSKPLTIALFPGSFKPPHKGHLLAAEALGAQADLVYIFVSAPQLSGRSLKSGKTITADQAVQIWGSFLDNSPIKNKAKVMIGPDGVASPMMTAINFIQHPADPNNMFAAPPNSTVILGVGDKDSDADRYGERILKKSKEMRPDLTIKKMAVGPFTHSPDYLNLLKQHPAIAGILNKGKGRDSDAQLYHASDMRDFIDLATEDPLGVEFLKDFVPLPEDVFAVMGVLGLNPADKRDQEEDQVQEPELDQQEVEIDPLQEIINQEATIFYEAFQARQTPKSGPSKGKFQRKMRKRLSKAHSTYLDMGRKDLTKHGGGFHKPRPKNISNAFLAEEEIEEMSISANVAGAPMAMNTNKRDDKKMNDEKRLRMKIRKGLKKFFEEKAVEHESTIASVLEEHQLRLQLRNIILEQSLNEAEDPTTDVHDNTGINTLKDLMKNTNVLSTLREVYKTLTTDEDQKRSFRAHIIQWVQDTLAPVKLNDTDAESGAAQDIGLNEEVGVDIEGVDAEKFIGGDGIKDGSEKDEAPEPEEEETMRPIDGEDTTGRNKAERVYPTIEKSIVDYYSELDNAGDQEMFYDYLIANLKLYFDKWDGEMSKGVTEPTNDEYEKAKQAV